MKKISVVLLIVLVILVNVTMAAANMMIPMHTVPVPEKSEPTKNIFKRPSYAAGRLGDFGCNVFVSVAERNENGTFSGSTWRRNCRPDEKSKEERKLTYERYWRGGLSDLKFDFSSDKVGCSDEKDRIICDIEKQYKKEKYALEGYAGKKRKRIKESSDPDEMKAEDLKNLERLEKKELERIEKIKNAILAKVEEIRKEDPNGIMVNESELWRILGKVEWEINEKARREAFNDEKEQLEKMLLLKPYYKYKKEYKAYPFEEKEMKNDPNPSITVYPVTASNIKEELHMLESMNKMVDIDLSRIKDVNEKADPDKKTGKNGAVPEKKEK